MTIFHYEDEIHEVCGWSWLGAPCCALSLAETLSYSFLCSKINLVTKEDRNPPPAQSELAQRLLLYRMSWETGGDAAPHLGEAAPYLFHSPTPRRKFTRVRALSNSLMKLTTKTGSKLGCDRKRRAPNSGSLYPHHQTLHHSLHHSLHHIHS